MKLVGNYRKARAICPKCGGRLRQALFRPTSSPEREKVLVCLSCRVMWWDMELPSFGDDVGEIRLVKEVEA